MCSHPCGFYSFMFTGHPQRTLMDGGISAIKTENSGDEFLKEALVILMQDAVQKGTDRGHKVCEWMEPEKLHEILDLKLQRNGESQEVLLGYCRDIVRFSVKTGHPRFFNQLFSGLDRHALTGRILSETLNTSQYTYEVAPVFVLMEEEVLTTLRHYVGWTAGDGIFCPGGSISNMYAINVARFHRFPHAKEKGLSALPRMTIFTTHESHYSVRKGAAFLGIGTDNIILVQTNDRGKMLPEDLEKKIEKSKSEGAVPFLVSATCGTTVLGAFDPIADIADVCERHGLWLHADAAFGGSALLSSKHRHLLHGIERANSVTWNPHKMLGVGLQCSAFLLPDTTGLLQRCHAANATYLFQTDKFYDLKYDTGDKSIQCGRRVDCLKLWLMWKALGSQGLEKRVDKALEQTRYLVEEMKAREGFCLIMEPEFVNLCFWYVPPSLRDQQDSPDYWQRLGKVAPVIKERMIKKGSMMVGYQPHGDRVNFFRQVLVNPALTKTDLDFFLDEIELLAEDL
ncbi:cysteine sulfinic acid decarboxylase isoform X2 [Xenopus laevis]|uniref:Cysteine sulfinic acid decarboxylase isoform X2 n=1 Tax=Xenopus laevis TaxID=8355 RepID=A0A8J1MA97_XENLA|nr:cysteine sulfinic acid decarboxylase isoform X2 [Xenopus laevis]